MSGLDFRELLKASAEAGSLDRASGSQPRPARSLPPAETVTTVRLGSAISPVILVGCIRLLEFVLVAAAGFAVYAKQLVGVIPLNWLYGAAIIGLAGLTIALLQAFGAYRIMAFRSLFRVAPRMLAAWSLVFLIALAAMFFAKVGDHYSRVWLATFYAAGLGAIVIERIVLSLAVSSQAQQGVFDRRTAIVGGGESAEGVIRALDQQTDTGIKIVGIFDDREDGRSADMVAGYPKLGSVDDLVAFARRTKLDLVIFTLPVSAETRILEMLAKLWVLPIDIRLSAHASKLRLRPRSYSYIGTVPVLDVFDRPIADWDIVLKAVFDRVIGSVLLVLLAPVLILTALAVKLGSPGPILFRQKRYGFNNELIEVLKFRSMYVDQSDAGAAKLVGRNDPRVTRVGRFIRKTSLDELPQLLNVVFKGNLSLVGPRPHALQAKAENRLYDQVVDGYFARHRVKPGITGWAQVNGWRGETDTSEKLQRRVEHDLYYIENWSVFFDLQILAVTPFALLKTENAY